MARLDAYAALLLKWQNSINLVAPSTLPSLWTRHLEEGLFLGSLMPKYGRVVDIGSGGGLPGLVLAILRTERGLGVDLVESNGKKAAFLRTVVRELGLNAAVHASRVEDCGAILEEADLVTARALASLDRLMAMVGPHVKPTSVCWFPKGRDVEAEIAEASAHWRFTMVKHSSKVTPDSVVLEIARLEGLGA
ncbi:16S rRNA (guanine(527)-N(7))-methyltransferase RsmG [Aureimonas populi]|uniref:Ribosomal RNA small subunit methyltransferase G n=1 Tax=Aureimonas populi TaxID=1701758 RepID=A0ABW5CQS5_9HYPH|nr:16S rRNA (guanine(527)-N(7))-methyltransferase RsmG [Aureimonas populi]